MWHRRWQKTWSSGVSTYLMVQARGHQDLSIVCRCSIAGVSSCVTTMYESCMNHVNHPLNHHVNHRVNHLRFFHVVGSEKELESIDVGDGPGLRQARSSQVH